MQLTDICTIGQLATRSPWTMGDIRQLSPMVPDFHQHVIIYSASASPWPCVVYWHRSVPLAWAMTIAGNMCSLQGLNQHAAMAGDCLIWGPSNNAHTEADQSI